MPPQCLFNNSKDVGQSFLITDSRQSGEVEKIIQLHLRFALDILIERHCKEKPVYCGNRLWLYK
jgi:hypothetical protein